MLEQKNLINHGTEFKVGVLKLTNSKRTEIPVEITILDNMTSGSSVAHTSKEFTIVSDETYLLI